MGQARHRVSLWVWALALLALMACGGPKPPEFDRLLLNAADLPGQEVETVGPETSAAATGQASAQVTLRGPDFAVHQSVIWFDNPQQALATLEIIKQDQAQRGFLAPPERSQFDGLSATVPEGEGDTERVSLVFVEGPALARLSVSGPQRQQLLPQLAEAARRKLGK